MIHHLTARALRLIRGQFLGMLALALVLTGGAAYAAAAKDSVVSRSIKNGQVKTVDLKDGAVTGAKVADGSVTGDDVDESTLSLPQFATSNVYKVEAATDAGQTLGDGTSTKFKACDAGDILLSGGPASMNATSDLIESFPTPGSTNSWSARIDKNGVGDSWTVVVLCLDQA